MCLLFKVKILQRLHTVGVVSMEMCQHLLQDLNEERHDANPKPPTLVFFIGSDVF